MNYRRRTNEEIPCAECNGTGAGPHDRDCFVCNGSGHFNEEPDEEIALEEEELYSIWDNNNE